MNVEMSLECWEEYQSLRAQVAQQAEQLKVAKSALTKVKVMASMAEDWSVTGVAREALAKLDSLEVEG